MKILNNILKMALVLIASHFHQTAKAQSEAAVKLFEEGRAHVNKNESDLAIISFTEAIKLFPDYASAYNFRGIEYSIKKEYDIAISDYKEAIRIVPTYSNAYRQLGGAYHAKAEYEQGIRAYNEAIRHDPKDKYSYLNLGKLYHDKKDYEMAISNFNEVIRLDPKGSNAYFFRALCYLDKKEYDKAVAGFSETIRLAPGFSNAHYYLGITYTEKENNDLAIQEYTKAINLNPKATWALNSRGYNYMYTGQNDLALQDFSEAIRIDPMLANAYDSRGEFHKSIGQYELAIKDFKKCIEIDPNFANTYINVISSYARMQNFSQAKEDYNRYLSKRITTLNKEDWKFYNFYITAAAEHIPNGLYQQALDNLNTAISEYGTKVKDVNRIQYTDILSLKGYVLEKLNRKAEAKDVYNQTLTINPNQPEVKLAIAAISKTDNTVAKVVKGTAIPTVVEKVDSTPPIITITSPSVTRGIKVVQKNKLAIVTGKTSDESGIYEVTVNGKEANVDASGNFSANIPLAVGDNQLMVTATDAKMNKGSFNFTINRQAEEIIQPLETPVIVANIAEVTPEGKYYALIIGVEDYIDETINDLDRPVADANSLYKVLTTRYTFDETDISLLKNPTRDQLFESLEKLSKQVKSTDNLLIFYAGHGFWDENRSQGYWFPSDARRLNRSSWLTNADLKEYIGAIDSKHTLLISDACFSGGIFKSRAVMAGASRAVKELYDLPSRKAMTSGTLKEVPDQSVFIEYLVKRLQQNTDVYLSAEQLFSSLRTAVINNSSNGQVPQFGEIREAGDEGGDFIFIKK